MWLLNLKSMYKKKTFVNGVGGRDLFRRGGSSSMLSPLLFIMLEALPRGLMTEDCLGSCYRQLF